MLKSFNYALGLANETINGFRSRPLVRDTVTTTFFSTIGKAVGFLVPFFIAAWFGVGANTDAFFFAYDLILLLAIVFSSSIESIIVPFIADARSQGEDVGAFVGKTLGISTGWLGVFTIAFLLIIRPILSVVANFTPQGLDLICVVFLESFPLVILLFWTSTLAGTLNAYKFFTIPALSPALRAVVTILFIFFFKGQLGVHAIAWGYVLGELFRMAMLLVALNRLNHFHLKLSFKWDRHFMNYFQVSSYQIFGMAFYAFAPVMNKVMVSWLGIGKISILAYAERLFLAVTNLLLLGLVTVVLSFWSEQYYSNKDNKSLVKQGIIKTAKWMAIFSIVITIVIFLIRDSFITIVYKRGIISQDTINAIQSIFIFT
jgi:Uncharacterized membrane protein, putative virulence factor